jgi:hypothetical protein
MLLLEVPISIREDEVVGGGLFKNAMAIEMMVKGIKIAMIR